MPRDRAAAGRVSHCWRPRRRHRGSPSTAVLLRALSPLPRSEAERQRSRRPILGRGLGCLGAKRDRLHADPSHFEHGCRRRAAAGGGPGPVLVAEAGLPVRLVSNGPASVLVNDVVSPGNGTAERRTATGRSTCAQSSGIRIDYAPRGGIKVFWTKPVRTAAPPRQRPGPSGAAPGSAAVVAVRARGVSIAIPFSGPASSCTGQGSIAAVAWRGRARGPRRARPARLVQCCSWVSRSRSGGSVGAHTDLWS
jgi:hypothetical protein